MEYQDFPTEKKKKKKAVESLWGKKVTFPENYEVPHENSLLFCGIRNNESPFKLKDIPFNIRGIYISNITSPTT